MSDDDLGKVLVEMLSIANRLIGVTAQTCDELVVPMTWGHAGSGQFRWVRPPHRRAAQGGGRGPALRRGLCRNPPIPAHVEGSRSVSIGHRYGAGKIRQTRLNTAFPCRSRSLGVAICFSRQRTVTAEAAGSSPVVPAILHFLNIRRWCRKGFLDVGQRPTPISSTFPGSLSSELLSIRGPLAGAPFLISRSLRNLEWGFCEM